LERQSFKTFQLGNPNEGRRFGKLRCKWEGNIKPDLKIAGVWARFFSAFHKRWGISWLAKLLGDCGPNPIKSAFLHLRHIRIGLNVIMAEKGG